jgi:molecular chaperone IbpA
MWGTKDMDKFFVGFDDQFARLQKLHEDVTKNIPNYPPYNIRRNMMTLTTQLRLLSQVSLSKILILTIDGGKLVVRGNIDQTEEQEDSFLFKGIANRAFTRAFALDDQVEVRDAEIFNGMLKIALERLIPEAKKPKKIAVKSTGEKQLLT